MISLHHGNGVKAEMREYDNDWVGRLVSECRRKNCQSPRFLSFAWN